MAYSRNLSDMDCHGLSWTVMDFHGLSWTIIDYYSMLRLLTLFWCVCLTTYRYNKYKLEDKFWPPAAVVVNVQSLLHASR